jgi:DNA repair protein SbcD/Mre11
MQPNPHQESAGTCSGRRFSFAFYTDTHITGVSPRHRVDDFPRSILDKIREVYSVAEDRGCEFLAFGGDFFNTHRIFSYEILGNVMDIVGGSPLPTYACIGEHDLYGHSPKTYESSTLAFFAKRCPQFTNLFSPVEVATGVWLHGKHEWEPVGVIDKPEHAIDRAVYNILVCHELITNRQAPFDVTHTSVFQNCPYDLVVSGDLHNGYDPHEVNGTWFCNPGAIARRSISDMWSPTVAIIEIEKGIPPIFDMVRLKSARPHDEVFGEGIAEVALTKENKERDGHELAEELMKFEVESVDVHDLIQKAGRAKGIKEPVLHYLSTKKPEE